MTGRRRVLQVVHQPPAVRVGQDDGVEGAVPVEGEIRHDPAVEVAAGRVVHHGGDVDAVHRPTLSAAFSRKSSTSPVSM